MNILVIGNGFDLAHGLLTKYTDFLEFIKIMKQNIRRQKIKWGNINPQIRTLIEKNMSDVNSQKVIWEPLIQKNFWIEYFQICDMYQKENWIDFESEISNVIKSLYKDMKNYDRSLDNSTVLSWTNLLLERKLHEYFANKDFTYKMIRDTLINDLNKLIKALEIYLADYVNQIDCKIGSLDIKNSIVKKFEYENGTRGAIVSKVLCFNYTNTFERIYKNINVNYIDYIHGKANSNNTIESNNMVLGIDEYLSDDRKNKDVEFIAFKKYYQRIYKQTGCEYKQWVEEIKANKSKKHNLSIFGHSLDVTDKDILRDLILNDNVYTTIFYPDKEELGRKIANLVKVIGQDELIRRTGGSTKTIEFKLQQDMIKRENI